MTMLKRLGIGLGLGLLLLLGVVTQGGLAWADSSERPYRQVAPSADGIGKVYMGREIAAVMGHEGAYWLERPIRD